MKKKSLLLIGGIFLIITSILLGQMYLTSRISKIGEKKTTSQQQGIEISDIGDLTPQKKNNKLITVSIDFGDGNNITDTVEAENAYESLIKIAQRNNLAVEKKEYKYGIMVEKIGEKANSGDSFWAYYVNGKAARIASDRNAVYPGFKVEWKYEKVKK